MPFTLAHPAAIIPLVNRKYFSVSALVAGSIVPDMEFYLRLRETNNFGHSAIGIFLFDIPMAILMCHFFHMLIRNKLIANSPDFIAARCYNFMFFDWKKYALSHKLAVFISVLSGIATHFLLDFFTHGRGFLPIYFNWLEQVLIFPGIEIPVYTFLQISLSIIGLALILNEVLKLPRTSMQKNSVKNKSTYWLVILSMSIAIFTIRLIILTDHTGFWDIFIAINGSLIYATILTSILLKEVKPIHAL